MLSFATLPIPLLVLALSSLTAAVSDVPSGLDINTTVAVTCSRPTRDNDRIAVHYKGRLASTGVEFDQSYSRGSPITFVLGAGRVIKGWDLGLLDMCPGEERTLTISPDLGYGSRGGGPIPPGATLIFETKLVEIIGVKQEFVETVVATPSAATSTESEGMFSIATAPASPDAAYEELHDALGSHSSGVTDVDEVQKGSTDAAEAQKESDELEGYHDLIVGEGPKDDDDDDDDDSDDDDDDDHHDDDGPSHPGKQAECHLLGPFALLVQAALGGMALLTLVWKRYRETPKRPWKIFFFDVSKQVMGSMFTHVLNLAMSMLSSVAILSQIKAAVENPERVQAADGRMPNPCSYYLLNLGIDTTIGIPVLYVLLKVFHALALHTPLARPPQSIKSGNYGPPPYNAFWWLKQLIIYFVGLAGMKLFVFFLFSALPWLPWVGDWALRWTQGNEVLEVTFAMFIFPLIMNAVQYWIIDNFIMERKGKEEGKGDYAAVHGDEDDEEARRAYRGEDGEGSVTDVDDEFHKDGPLTEVNPTPIPDREGSSASGSRNSSKAVKTA